MNREALDASSSAESERRALEAMMDEILADSFPASDPPAWSTAAGRLKHIADREPPELRSTVRLRPTKAALKA